MEPYDDYDYDNDINNSFFKYSADPPMNFMDSNDNREIFSFDYNKPCDNNSIGNNALFGLTTRATLNDKENEVQDKEKSKMNLIIPEEIYINIPVEKDKIETKKRVVLEGKDEKIQGAGNIINLVMII